MRPIIIYIAVLLATTIVHGQDKATVVRDSVLMSFEEEYNAATTNASKIDALLKIGDYHVFRQTERSLPVLDEALELFNADQTTKDSAQIGNIYKNYGIAHRRLGNFQKALAYNQRAYDVYHKIKDSINMGQMYQNISVMYRNIDELDKCITYGKKAIAINKKINGVGSLGYNHNNVAQAFLGLKEEDSAIWYFNRARAYFTQIGNQSGVLRVNGSYARILINRGQYNEALDIYLKNLNYREATNYKQDVTYLSLIISRVYIKLNDAENALKYADKALAVAKEENLIQRISQAYRTKARALILANRYKEAYNNIILHHQYRDSILNIENIKKIQELELTYEFRKEKVKDSLQMVKEREVAETRVSLLEAKNKINRQWMLFGGAGLMALFAIVYLMRSKRFAVTKQKMQESFSQGLLLEQEKERSRLARELHDSVGQKMMLLSKTIKNSGDHSAEALAKESLDEVRTISRGLHPSNLERLGLTEAINALVYDINANTGLFFTEDIDNIDNVLPKESELHLYRIIQESLSNIIKHAEAKAVKMKINKEDHKISILVSDNGKGFNMEAKNKSLSLGLKTLFERAKIIGAQLSLHSEKNKGTMITLNIPI